MIVGRIPGLTDQYVVFGWLVLFLPLIIVFAGGMVLLVSTWLAFHSVSRWLAFAAVACWGGVLLAEFFEAARRPPP